MIALKRKLNSYIYNSIKNILRNKLNLVGEDLLTENYKTLLKEIKDVNINKWKSILCSWIRKL